MAIRYNSQLKAELRKAVKSFNAKIRRLEEKGVSAALLPDKVSSKEIQAGIKNRRDLRKRLQQLNEFTSAGVVEESAGGLMGTDELFIYRKGEANRAIREINKDYEKLLNLETDYPMMIGEQTANLRTKMEYLSRDIRTMDVKQINIFNKNILTLEQKTLKDENFYNNFQKMLFYSGYRGGLKPSKVREISELIEKFTPEQLLDIYSTNPALKSMVEGYNRMKNNIGEVDEADTEDVANAIIEALLEKL